MLTKLTVPLNKKILSPLVFDYLSRKEEIIPFYNYFPDKDGFQKAIDNFSFKSVNRSLLTRELLTQAESVANTNEASRNNIQLLSDGKSFTVTTGHQLCLFTGPLYFIYKIFSVINLCESLKKEFPANNFVPVYWLASEDHDIDEINNFNVFGKKIVWETAGTGSAGDLTTEGLDKVFTTFSEILGSSGHALALQQLFRGAYLKHDDLKSATRYLVNELFGKYGLVIVDGNSPALKKEFIPYFKKDIFENIPFKKVNASISRLDALDYEPQVNPREINCFYIEKNFRGRIENENSAYSVIGKQIALKKQELENIVETETEKISPNVVMRPCYQQAILPNIAYVGGPGELSYWLEYKEMFETLDLQFPLLVPRNFVMLYDKSSLQKISKMGLQPDDFFKEENDLIKLFMERENKTVDLDSYRQSITELFSKISESAKQVDPTLKSTVEAESQKSVNSVNIIEQKMNRALKQRSETELNQLKSIRARLFPNNIPQERFDNFSMYYQKWGNEFLDQLKNNLTYDLNSFGITLLLEK